MGKVGGLFLRRGMFTALAALLCGQVPSAFAQTAADLRTAVPDPATVQMPDLAFTSSPEIEGAFD